ncbi:MAG: outer membrane beta-barrel protein [Holosporales bacterium]|jgi:opacity protein-like surface antigen|nr:outer membrane beta-barrel protein [Holosporales bacterium]
MNYKLILFSLTTFGIASLANSEECDLNTKQAIETAAEAEQKNDQEISGDEELYKSKTTNVVSVTGFYGGADVGIDFSKSKFSNDKDYQTAGDDSEKKKLARKRQSKTGFLGDIFAGYNCQFGKFMMGLECFVDMKTSKHNVEVGTETKQSVSLKRKYSFGINPRVGYAIFDSFFGYVTIGTTLSKHTLNAQNKSAADKKAAKHPSKTSLFVGLGVEQNFGPLFIRGEVNKMLNKKLGEIEGVKTSVGSYVFRVGGGYRF